MITTENTHKVAGSSNFPAGTSPKKIAFDKYFDEVGRKPYSPEFIDAMIATMKYSECLTERLMTWVRWRSNRVYSPYAVSGDWRDPGHPLDQMDAIIDLAAFEGGKSAEEILAMSESERAEARESAKGMKGHYSRAFARLEEEGRIEFRGRLIYPTVSPDIVNPKPKVARYSNFLQNPEFRAWQKVARYSNFQTSETVRKLNLEVAKVDRKDYRDWLELLKQATSEPVSANVSNADIDPLIRINKDKEEDQGYAAAATYLPEEPAAAADYPIPEPEPEPQESQHSRSETITPETESRESQPQPEPDEQDIVGAALRRFGVADIQTVERLLKWTRQDCPDATAAEIAQAIEAKGRSISGNVKNAVGVLMTSVPSTVRTARETHKEQQKVVPIARALAAKCPKCRDSGWVGDTGSSYRPCDCAEGVDQAKKHPEWMLDP